MDRVDKEASCLYLVTCVGSKDKSEFIASKERANLLLKDASCRAVHRQRSHHVRNRLFPRLTQVSLDWMIKRAAGIVHAGV